jgi:hypothetical protein
VLFFYFVPDTTREDWHVFNIKLLQTLEIFAVFGARASIHHTFVVGEEYSLVLDDGVGIEVVIAIVFLG